MVPDYRAVEQIPDKACDEPLPAEAAVMPYRIRRSGMIMRLFVGGSLSMQCELHHELWLGVLA